MALPVLTETAVPEPSPGRVSFFSFSRSELSDYLAERFGFSSYRANQLFQWVYQKEVYDLSSMTNIKKSDREVLEETFAFSELEYSNRQVSVDGTRKYLIPVFQDHHVESVMIKQPTRMTLCVSSQVGCALGCKFCQTGTMGLIRHLSTEEIIQQVLTVRKDAANFGDMFSNMVFMGMGEPFHNFDNLERAILILNDDFGIGLSGRKITVSTVGLVPAIKKFGDSPAEANLAVSLNATTDEVRSEIMPINRKFPLEVLLQTLREFPLRRRKRITIEYVMLGGVNDTEGDLRRLPKLLRGIPCKVNLIPYNSNAGLGFESPSDDKARHWQRALMKEGLTATIRWSKGQDIDAACGQLVTNSIKSR